MNVIPEEVLPRFGNVSRPSQSSRNLTEIPLIICFAGLHLGMMNYPGYIFIVKVNKRKKSINRWNMASINRLFSVTVLLGLGMLLIFPHSLRAQQVTLRFFDSVTGYALSPERVAFYDQDGNVLTPDVADFQDDFSQPYVLPLPGNYTIVVTANGYYQSEAAFVIAKDAPLQIGFHLDPLTPATESTSSYLRQQRRDGVMFFSGFVTDARTGLPLANARIRLLQSQQQTTTDERGYFQLYAPVIQDTITVVCEKEGYISRHYSEITVWEGGDCFFRIRMVPGSGDQFIGKNNRFDEPATAGDTPEENCQDCPAPSPSLVNPSSLPTPVLLRHTIRVGRNCSGTNCTTVEVYTLQTYCKFVLPAEWIACWGNLSNGIHSLRAGAVAVRTYASWFVYHPLSNNYDICDNTYCQYFGDTQYSNTNTAVDETERYVLINTDEQIVKSEYSAENNDSGCGDGWSGTGTTWPCIYDPVCQGQPNFGHGRGMCQWGSIRWANGTKVLPGAPCTEGNPHGFGTKTWNGILSHYYPDYTLVQGAAAHIVNAVPVPATVSPGQTFRIDYTINAAPAMPVMLGASVAPTGTGNWIDDPANDVKVNADEGVSVVSRFFQLPGNASPGSYDLLVALWYDVDNNDQINSGDFVLHLTKFPEALTVSPTAIDTFPTPTLARRYALFQNYPNPFNPSTTIAFALPRPGRVSLKIFDASGKEVAILVNENLPVGNYRIPWNAQELPSGVYFYRLTVRSPGYATARFTETRKMILTK